MRETEFIKRFQVPEVALSVISQIVDPDEILLLESVESESFNVNAALHALNSTTEEKLALEQVKALLQRAYQRGVLELEDESYELYRIGSFYSRLDIFAISEPKTYSGFPWEIRLALDKWYFEEYLKKLDYLSSQPTEDKVVTLAKAIEYIDSVERQIWLNRCDCRTLAGNCDLPAEVCISFRSGINTFQHRGWSTPITKEQAKAVLEKADRAGLMHTINPGGICNCCDDCCYLFRAQRERNSNPVWPAAPYVAVFKQESCVNCRLCIKRCHFGAFKRTDGVVRYSPELCRGCGLCSRNCPGSAIEIVERGK